MRIGITSRKYVIMPRAIPSSCCSTLRSSAGMESRSYTFNAGDHRGVDDRFGYARSMGDFPRGRSDSLLDEDLTRNGEEFVILDELAASHVKASSFQA